MIKSYSISTLVPKKLEILLLGGPHLHLLKNLIVGTHPLAFVAAEIFLNVKEEFQLKGSMRVPKVNHEIKVKVRFIVTAI